MESNHETANIGAIDDAHLATTDLTEVIGEGPAAVLLVDLRTRQIVHASPVAEQLAPDTCLPIGLDAWSDAAELRDRDGAELAETDHPLSRVARAELVAGQAVSAARRSDLGSRREPLWVVAVPMTGAAQLEHYSLVVFLPLRSYVADQEAALHLHTDRAAKTTLNERAVIATGLSFTVADARHPDQPLVWVNPAFTETTGYEFGQAVGRNCRFLQGPATDRSAVAAIRTALDAGHAVTTTLLNYRADSTPFWNQVDISPVLGPDGDVTHFVGIQTDVSERVDADRARDRALESERVARAAAETAQRRLRFLIDSIDSLSRASEVSDIPGRLLDLAVPELADWALVVHRSAKDAVVTVVGTHADADLRPLVAELADALPAGLRQGTLDEVFLHGSQVRLIANLDHPDNLDERTYLSDPTLTRYTTRLGGHSALLVALPGRRDVDDLLVLVRATGRPRFDDDEVAVARDLGRRAGLILTAARDFHVQTNIAETLQRSLLPTLPRPHGLTIAARYRASEIGAQVGGDFYEVLDLPWDGVGFAIGDVTGHDVHAAAAMGHLQGLLRAGAHRHYSQPGRVLQAVDTLLTDLGLSTIATAVYGHLSLADDTWVLRWTSAGHLPLVLRHPDGTAEMLTPADDMAGPILGLSTDPRLDNTRRLHPGTTILGYTDGLVERRGEILDLGLDRLLAAVSSSTAGPEGLCDHLLDELAGEQADDIAMLAIHLVEH